MLRSQALADAWIARGGSATIASGVVPLTLRNRLENSRCGFELWQKTGNLAHDVDQLKNLVKQKQSEWIVLDADADELFYDVFTGKIRAETGCYILLINQCLNPISLFADVVLNQNPFARKNAVSDELGRKPLWLDGSKFALIPSGFERTNYPPAPVAGRSQRVLLCLHGYPQIDKVLNEFAGSQLSRNLNIDLLYTGTDPNKVDVVARESGLKVTIHKNIDRLDDLLKIADITVTQNGMFGYDLAYLGIPNIVVIDHPQKKRRIGRVTKSHTKTTIRASDVTWPKRLCERVEQILTDVHQYESLVEQSRILVDSSGADRICRQLLRLNSNNRRANSSRRHAVKKTA